MAITAKNTKGFTLIEMIVVLVLVGIITVFAGMGIVRVTQGFLFTKENAATLQKGQMVMARLIKEFTVIKSIDEDSDADSMEFKAQKWFPGEPSSTEVTGKIEVDLGSLNLTLNGNTHTLTDNVDNDNDSGFSLKYYAADGTTECAPDGTTECAPESAKIIQITLRLEGAEGITSEFTSRVTPRNISGE
jgi:prepilin-type N-terminal cleavage/methylation domain-containing protein